MVSIHLDPEALRPLIERTVAEVIAQVEADRTHLDAKLAYSEPEAAELLSLRPHQLRDERLRGRIQASAGPGRKVLYTREDLLGYLARRRMEK